MKSELQILRFLLGGAELALWCLVFAWSGVERKILDINHKNLVEEK